MALRVNGYTPPVVAAQLTDQSAALAAALEAARVATARAEAATAAATAARAEAVTAATQATTAQAAATTAQATATAARTDVATVRTLIATGSAQSTSTLLAGATITLRVPLAPAMPDAQYAVATSLVTSASGLLGSVRVDAVTLREPAAVTVQLRNTGLTALGLTGSTVTAIAFATVTT